MECKLTILMRALLAVALVAITLVLTYEFWRAGNGIAIVLFKHIEAFGQAHLQKYLYFQT